jgi:hypothetical protein
MNDSQYHFEIATDVPTREVFQLREEPYGRNFRGRRSAGSDSARDGTGASILAYSRRIPNSVKLTSSRRVPSFFSFLTLVEMACTFPVVSCRL